MGILIIFMGDITPKIFNQCVIAVFTCVFYSYMHVIWSPDSLLLTFPFVDSTRVQLTGVNSKTREC